VGLSTDVGTFVVTSTGGNPVTATNAGTSSTTLNVSTGGAGAVSFTQQSGSLRVDQVSTTGNITLQATAGAIEESGSDQPADLVGDAATLSAATGIGTLGALETTLHTVNAVITGSGSLRISETDDLTLMNVSTANGDLDLTTTGTLTLGTLDLNGAAGVTAGGSILDGDGSSLLNLTTTAPSFLSAGGIIGTAADPIEVSVVAGPLSVSAGAATSGVSVNLSGTVSPSNTLNLLNTPPGQVVFNGVVLFPPPPPAEPPLPPAPPPVSDAPPVIAPSPPSVVSSNPVSDVIPVIAPSPAVDPAAPAAFQRFFSQLLSVVLAPGTSVTSESWPTRRT
jgi:hypothetical protein